METGVTAPLSPGISLVLLLIAGGEIMAAVTPPRIYAAVNTSVTLDISNCKREDIDTITWKKSKTEIIAKARALSEVASFSSPGSILHRNGSLTLSHVLAGETVYNAETHNKNGKQACNPIEIHVIGQYKVDKPTIMVRCGEKRGVLVSCSVSQGTDPKLTLKGNNFEERSVNDKVLNQTIILKNQPSSITCFANNYVSSENSAKELKCDDEKANSPLTWYLILAAAAGGVAFIIFLILIIYSVRSCKRSGRTEEEPAYYNNQARSAIQQRQLPTLPGQTAAPSVTPASEEPEHLYAKKTPSHHSQGAPETAPGGKKRRPPPPHLPTDTLPLSAPAEKPAKLPVPGNHPSDRLPQPHPRTTSKPPRKQRRSQKLSAT